MLRSVISVCNDGLGGISSIDNSLSNLTSNILGGRCGRLSSLTDSLGGSLGTLDNLCLDLLGLGDALNSNELCLENCRFVVLGGEYEAGGTGGNNEPRVEPAGIGPMARWP